jgi:hypothetical protein
MKRRAVYVIAGAALLIVIGIGGIAILQRDRSQTSARIPPDARAPEGTRIRVEVLNATRTRGLARLATMHLRDRGFDVVAVGTSPQQRDSTLVLDRSGHPEWAALVARAMNGAHVEVRPDSSRYLDVTVLIGAAWRPPPEPFYP